ncbi:MAG: mechanosensitive ion channel family protein [Flavobacterium sp.]|nr:mechanosensitive ion channel family protein [Flavobacterium sp.]
MLTTHPNEWIASAIVILTVLCCRIIVAKLVRRYANSSQIIEKRANLVIKYLHILLSILALFGCIIIWGVDKKAIFLTISSITTVVGVAMFATWSILSNITAGVILFFFFPFRIGDTIIIHDKDFPIEAEIEDINAFHVLLVTASGEKITYPNNLLLQKGISVCNKSN